MAPGLDIGPVLLLLLAAEGGPQQGRRRASVGGCKRSGSIAEAPSWVELFLILLSCSLLFFRAAGLPSLSTVPCFTHTVRRTD